MLSAAERLRRRREFQRIYAEGSHVPESLVVLHALSADRPDLRQVGFSVSRKVGGAVVRNKVKRRMREAFRSLLPRIKGGWLMVFVARSKAAQADYAALVGSMERALQRAGVLESRSELDSRSGAP